MSTTVGGTDGAATGAATDTGGATTGAGAGAWKRLGFGRLMVFAGLTGAPPGQFICTARPLCLCLICPPERRWTLLLCVLLKCTAQRSKVMLAQAYSMPGASKKPKLVKIEQHQNPIRFRVDRLHANGLVPYASDVIQLHNKTGLRRGGRRPARRTPGEL